jgi:hypothetical protein
MVFALLAEAIRRNRFANILQQLNDMLVGEKATIGNGIFKQNLFKIKFSYIN